jgi:hypothetical protein
MTTDTIVITANAPDDTNQMMAAILKATHKPLSAAQQQRLEGCPKPVQKRIQRRIKAALEVSVLSHLDYCAQVSIDPTAFERIVASEEADWAAEANREALARQLIQAGASLPMLKTLLGISNQSYISIRAALGMDGAGAFPQFTAASVDDTESTKLYREWERMGNPVTAEGFLHLHQTSGQPCRVLWGLVQDWQHAHQQRGTATRKVGG